MPINRATALKIAPFLMLAASGLLHQSRKRPATPPLRQPLATCLAPGVDPQEALNEARTLFSTNNIIHRVFSVEAHIFGAADLACSYRILDRVLQEVKSGIKEKMTQTDKMNLIYQALDRNFIIRGQEDGMFVNNLLRGQLDCDTTSLVAKSVAHELGLPLELVFVYGDLDLPSHVFVRWQEGQRYVNADVLSDKFVIGKYYISDDYTWNGGRRVMDDNGIISVVYSNLAGSMFADGNYRQALINYNKAIDLDPRSAAHYHHRGIARKKLGDRLGARWDYQRAVDLFPRYEPALDSLQRL